MECLECGYETKRATDWQRHLKSAKHHEITGLHCACGNKYRSTSALRRHEKTCLFKTTVRLAQEQAERDVGIAKEQRRLQREQMRIDEEKEELLELYRRDQIRLTQKYMDREDEHAAEMKKLYVDMAARPVTVNNTNTFNLAFFLNETCKNAQTIEQFMGSIPLCMNSAQSMGQHILENLNKCAVEDRPIHCTDLKRRKLAVKNGTVWEQDQKKVDPLVALNVNTLRQRYIRHLTNVWCPEHPNFETEDATNTEWVQLITMMCADLDEKFLNHIAKVTTIPKE